MEVKWKPPKCYADDMIVALTQALGEHVECLDIVFAILKEAGLQINLSKSSSCQKALEHVGF